MHAGLQGGEAHRAGGRCSQIQLVVIMQPARTQAATWCSLLSVPRHRLPALSLHYLAILGGWHLHPQQERIRAQLAWHT